MFLLPAAANVVNASGKLGGCNIHICRTPTSSATTIILTAAAELTPSTMSPTRSRIGRELETTGGFLLIVIDSTRVKIL